MNDQLQAAMRAAALPRSTTVEEIRGLIAEKRNIDAKISDLEQQLKDLNERSRAMEREHLVDLFIAAGITEISIPADGNLPAYDAKLTDYYRASIAASWSSERREAAFAALERLGLSGLLKNTVTAQFNRDEDHAAQVLVNQLANKGISATLSQSVPWQTLTAAIKELCESNRRPKVSDLDCLGADVGKVVKLKEKG